jgi:hypothetical protein
MTIDRARLTIPEHLTEEDANLYVDLYCERNRVSRNEIRTVRSNAWRCAGEDAVRQMARHLRGAA